jgi:hypothetical protein
VAGGQPRRLRASWGQLGDAVVSHLDLVEVTVRLGGG